MANLAHNFALAICNLVSRVLSRVDNYCQLLTKRVSRPKKYCSDISKKKKVNPPVTLAEPWQCGAGCAWHCQLWDCSPPDAPVPPAYPPFPSLHLLQTVSEKGFLVFIENLGGVRWELIQPPSIWRVSLQCATSQVCVTRCSHLLPLNVVVMPLNLPLRPLQITIFPRNAKVLNVDILSGIQTFIALWL